jgi:hypothetical protein
VKRVADELDRLHSQAVGLDEERRLEGGDVVDIKLAEHAGSVATVPGNDDVVETTKQPGIEVGCHSQRYVGIAQPDGAGQRHGLRRVFGLGVGDR